MLYLGRREWGITVVKPHSGKRKEETMGQMQVGMRRCKQHRNLTVIQRVFIENVIHISDGEPPEENADWYGDPVSWHDPRPISITVTCSDCGWERIYGSSAPLPKWVQSVWAVS